VKPGSGVDPAPLSATPHIHSACEQTRRSYYHSSTNCKYWDGLLLRVGDLEFTQPYGSPVYSRVRRMG